MATKQQFTRVAQVGGFATLLQAEEALAVAETTDEYSDQVTQKGNDEKSAFND